MKLSLSSHSRAPGPSAKRLGRKASRRESAFTLTELLLAVGLVLLLVGGVVFSFSNLLRGAQLEEGTTRIEGLLRFARAQAANTGRRVQIVFDDERTTNAPTAATSGIRLLWEPDPLSQPGRFEEFSEATWQMQGINDFVQVEDVQLHECHRASFRNKAAEDQILGGQKDEAGLQEPFAPITFYPDGSCESAEIILASRAEEEEQRMSVNLLGITGSISHHLITTNQDETPLEGSSESQLLPVPEDRGGPEAP